MKRALPKGIVLLGELFWMVLCRCRWKYKAI